MMAMVVDSLPEIGAADWKPGSGPQNPAIQRLCQQANTAVGYAGPPILHVGQRVESVGGFAVGTVFWPMRTWMRQGAKVEVSCICEGAGELTVHFQAWGGAIVESVVVPVASSYCTGSAQWEHAEQEVIVYVEVTDDTGGGITAVEGLAVHWLAARNVDPTSGNYLIDDAQWLRYVAEHEWADGRAWPVDTAQAVSAAPIALYRKEVTATAITLAMDEFVRPTHTVNPQPTGDTYIVRDIPITTRTKEALRLAVRSYRASTGTGNDEVIWTIDGVDQIAMALTTTGAQNQALTDGWQDMDGPIMGRGKHTVSLRYRAGGVGTAVHGIQDVSIYEVHA